MQAASRSKGSAPPPERAAAGSDRFVGKQDVTEDSLKLETVGLVRLEAVSYTHLTLPTNREV